MSALEAAVESGAKGYSSVYDGKPGQYVHFVDFQNGHTERVTEREYLLMLAAYNHGALHAGEQS